MLKLHEFILVPVLIIISALTIRYLVRNAKNGSQISVLCLGILFSLMLIWAVFYGVYMYIDETATDTIY